MEELLKSLTDKDNKAAYEFAKNICAESEKSDKYLDAIPLFAGMLQAESSYVRTRAFILICSQARWANAGQIEAVFDQMRPLLNDPKPSVVRQCLKALQELALFRPEMSESIRKTVAEIDPAKYKDSMAPLVRKDIKALLDGIV